MNGAINKKTNQHVTVLSGRFDGTRALCYMYLSLCFSLLQNLGLEPASRPLVVQIALNGLWVLVSMRAEQEHRCTRV